MNKAILNIIVSLVLMWGFIKMLTMMIMDNWDFRWTFFPWLSFCAGLYLFVLGFSQAIDFTH